MPQNQSNGLSDWQEEVETLYKSYNRSATSILRKDAAKARTFYIDGRIRRLVAQLSDKFWIVHLLFLCSYVLLAQGSPERPAPPSLPTTSLAYILPCLTAHQTKKRATNALPSSSHDVNGWDESMSRPSSFSCDIFDNWYAYQCIAAGRVITLMPLPFQQGASMP